MNIYKYSIFFVICFFTLLSCENTKLNKENSNQYQYSSSSSNNQSVPYYFRNYKNFNTFINSNDLSYREKESIINDFFYNIEEYSKNDISHSFSSIGSQTKWDVDLISQFHHNMQEVIVNNPEILFLALKNLKSDEIENFANFYFGSVIWNNNFPNELYYLNSHNPDAFKIFIRVFNKHYQSFSNELIVNEYIINDKDGHTNLRMESNSNSDIVGKIFNDSKVSALWKTGNWVFVYNDINLGYVHINNLLPAKIDPHKLDINNSANQFILINENDLYIDGKKYKIVATKPKSQDVRNFNINIEIYENKENEFYLFNKNNTMFKEPINGCMMDGLETITAVSNSFTIEYTSCYDNRYAERKVSFEYDSKYKDFKIVENKISFIYNNNEFNQTFNCKFNNFLFSSYDDSCEW